MQPPPLLPSPQLAQVWLDFDGTITRQDLLDELSKRYSIDDSWRRIERMWEVGEIGSQQCLERQFALIRISDADLAALLAEIEIDPGLIPLLEFLEASKIPRAILSDGVDSFIQALLARHGVAATVRSNSMERSGLKMRLTCPLHDAACVCAAAHCKCSSMAALSGPGRRSIYIGDGRSDLCPARRSEFVFAKGALAEALRGEGRAFVPYKTLLDVKRELERQWAT